MKIIEKNILTVERGIICQQVNCQGAMNSGLAKSIREKWPVVYDSYIIHFKHGADSFKMLGQYNYINVAPDLHICNIFGQLNFGYDGQRYTDYGALKMAFEGMTTYTDNKNRKYYFPYKFGACRGGGDFSIISRMIEYYFPNAILCKFP